MSIFNRQTIAAFLLGSTLAVGIGAYAVERHSDHHGGGPGSHIGRLYAEVQATDAQKAKIDPLVKAAMADLKPLHEQLYELHKKLLEQASAPTIDRAALEATRQQGLALADKASKRIIQLVADVGDTLTPEQRKKLADHIGRLHGRRMHGM
ncbi:protein refolding chaperone Spy/CpxP family [Duganella sp. CF402]|uniref:Spy/CpxP family protein refolding chaperone n=1 Tax=unclassified Duganella TaxID=2636909 RepID=UPI0008C2B4D4|nr:MULTISPECIES: Spy/CpxP family protein refolding chaperone [unclassified Duganella]RZT09533.1 Spy/CpxP family protein refolding chaperone [Duganella sp. BK701]SEL53614.1 protein refolding chaperone Spy/CpxP family [Duganella sp. CF402]